MYRIPGVRHPMAVDAERYLNSGMDGYVSKPIRTDSFARRT
jgi:hypothetical protein